MCQFLREESTDSILVLQRVTTNRRSSSFAADSCSILETTCLAPIWLITVGDNGRRLVHKIHLTILVETARKDRSCPTNSRRVFEFVIFRVFGGHTYRRALIHRDNCPCIFIVWVVSARRGSDTISWNDDDGGNAGRKFERSRRRSIADRFIDSVGYAVFYTGLSLQEMLIIVLLGLVRGQEDLPIKQGARGWIFHRLILFRVAMTVGHSLNCDCMDGPGSDTLAFVVVIRKDSVHDDVSTSVCLL